MGRIKGKFEKIWTLFRTYILLHPENFESRARRLDYIQKFVTPIAVFIVISAVNPFGIQDSTRSLSDVIVARVLAPFYPDENVDASSVALISDKSVLEAGLRWPMPSRDWQDVLVQARIHGPAAIFVDVMFADLREDPGLLESIQAPGASATLAKRCRPCEGAGENPINFLSCFFRPGDSRHRAVRGHDPLTDTRVQCPPAVGRWDRTPLFAAGANPVISPQARLAQALPRCSAATAEVMPSRQNLQTLSRHTVLPCLRNAASIVPIQWAFDGGDYPLVMDTALHPERSPNPQLEPIYRGVKYEPSAALAMLFAYCEYLFRYEEADTPLPRGCSDLAQGQLSMEHLAQRARRGDGRHLLRVEWRSRSPAFNIEHQVSRCSPPATDPELERDWSHAAREAVDIFFDNLFAAVSSDARDRLIKRCPPIRTVEANLRPKRMALDATASSGFTRSAVFIGANIDLAPDFQDTPLHATLPGVYLHAMAFDNLLTYGASYAHPPSSIIGVLGGWNTPFGQWFDVPLVSNVLNLPIVALFSFLCTLVVSWLAVRQYAILHKSDKFLTLDERLANFWWALGLIFLLIVGPIYLQARHDERITGLLVDWVLLLGIALTAFPTAPKTILFRAFAWFVAPRPRRRVRSGMLILKRVFLMPLSKWFPHKTARIRNRIAAQKRLTRALIVWIAILSAKIFLLLAPALFLMEKSISDAAASDLSIHILIGIFILLIWVVIERVMRFFFPPRWDWGRTKR